MAAATKTVQSLFPSFERFLRYELERSEKTIEVYRAHLRLFDS